MVRQIRYFVYNENNQLLGEYDSNGNAIAEYIYFGLRPVAVKNDSNINIVHTDYLGTPRVLTSGTGGGSIVWLWENINPYGNNIAFESVNFNLRFTGQYYDSESGLNYNINRYYDPESGRYIQSDPLGLSAGFNTYNYVNKNPINAVDPLGLEGYSASNNEFLAGAVHNPISSGPGYLSIVLHGMRGFNGKDGFILEYGSELERKLTPEMRKALDNQIVDGSGSPEGYGLAYFIDGNDLGNILAMIFNGENGNSNLKNYKGIKIYACNGAKLMDGKVPSLKNVALRTGKDVFGYNATLVAGFGLNEFEKNGNYLSDSKYYIRGYMKDGEEVFNLNGTDVLMRFGK